jgi:hypothetical protein
MPAFELLFRYGCFVKALYVIPNPCSRRWEDMQGDEVKRLCAACNTMVHAFHEYSTADWEQLWRESGGKVCGMLPQVSAPMPRSRRSILVGALLSLAAPLLAQNGRVRMVVTDPSGAVVANATTALLDKDDQPVRTIKTNDIGEAVWTDLPMGTLPFAVSQSGFKTRPLTVTVQGSAELRIVVVLDVGIAVDGGMIIAEEAVTVSRGGVVVPVRRKRKWWRIF